MDKKTEAQRSQITCQKSGKQSQTGLVVWDPGCVLNSILSSVRVSWIPQEYLFYPRSGYSVHCDIIHPFAFFLRSSVARATKRECVKPWVIGLITFLSLIVLAVCIGLIVHYVRYSKYGLPWHHVIYPKYFLLYIPVSVSHRLIHSLLQFICIAGTKNALPALFHV